MGILDDAIRQHLELKRQHGAENSDLERLENEAFGPATRPGDPEFADPATGEDVAAVETAAAGPVGPVADEAATTVAPAPDPEATPAEQARVEHEVLGDTADHPAPGPEQLGPESESEEAPAGANEPAPPEAPEPSIFDADDDLDLSDLDLDLDTGDESLPPAPIKAATPPAAAPPPAPDTPAAPAAEEAKPAEAPASDTEDDDLLEETPDFLQETPEGEDLWFEQGPPKDFDFDDDD